MVFVVVAVAADDLLSITSRGPGDAEEKPPSEWCQEPVLPGIDMG